MGVDNKFLDAVLLVTKKYVEQFENYLKGSNQLGALNTWEHLKTGYLSEVSEIERTGSWKDDVVIGDVESNTTDAKKVVENNGKQSGRKRRVTKNKVGDNVNNNKESENGQN